MALNPANIDVAVTGTVSYAVTTAPAPTNATSPLDAAYRDVGYVSDEGVKENRDHSTSNIVAWQGADVVRTVVTEASFTISFTMIETNSNSAELFYGAAVNATDGSVEIDAAATGGRRSLVVDYVDGTKFVRLYLPTAEVTEVGEVSLVSGDAVGYQVTVIGYPSASLGYAAKKWFSALDTA